MPELDLETLTPFQKHCAKWKKCDKCDLHKGRKRVVCFRGSIPCDFLLIGEGPGKTEDNLGRPFVGVAGNKLNEIVEKVLSAVNDYRGEKGLRLATVGFTNLVGCIPWNEDRTGVTSPPHKSITACSPRVVEIVTLCRPRLIICCGKEAETNLDQGLRRSIKLPRIWEEGIATVKIDHPSYILRKSYIEQGFLTRKAVITVIGAVEQLGDFE